MADEGSTIEMELTEFIVQEVLAEGGNSELGPNQPLLNGIVDSFGLMSIISFVEERYGVAVELTDVTTDNFLSVRALSEFIEARMAEISST